MGQSHWRAWPYSTACLSAPEQDAFASVRSISYECGEGVTVNFPDEVAIAVLAADSWVGVPEPGTLVLIGAAAVGADPQLATLGEIHRAKDAGG